MFGKKKSPETEEKPISEQEYASEGKKRKKYPRQYPDPTDLYVNGKLIGDDITDISQDMIEVYFNPQKTLEVHHLGLLWKIFPQKFKDFILDKAWNNDFLNDYAIKQHERVNRLNTLHAKAQLAHDVKKALAKVLLVGIIVGGSFGYYQFVKVPNEIFKTGIRYISNQQYSEAIETLKQLKGKKNSDIYIGFCMAKIAIQEQRYDDAYSIYEKLDKYASTIGITQQQMIDFKNETLYRKALYKYENKLWQEAVDILVPIIKYSNAVEYYQKCEYQLAGDAYEAGDKYEALRIYNGIATYEDCSSKMQSILSGLYETAMDKYKERNYIGAAEMFSSIAPYKFKDTVQMEIQCFYQQAQDEFAAGNYEKAGELFSQTPTYKDSQTMVKECRYVQIKKNNYTDNIVSLLALNGYRDTDKVLDMEPYNLYAEWMITEIDNRAANNEQFIFDTDGLFKCNETRLPNVAVATDTAKNSYTWNGECFETRDGQYRIYIEDFSVVNYMSASYETINLKCEHNGSFSEYRCQKVKELSAYYEAELVVNTADHKDQDLIDYYLKTVADKEDYVKPSEESETRPEQTSSGEQNLHEKFYAVVTEAQGSYIIVTPVADSPQYLISDTFKVNYSYSSELEVGDTVQIVYQENIIESQPPEINATRVQFISSGTPTETQPAEEITSVETETTETEAIQTEITEQEDISAETAETAVTEESVPFIIVG